MSLLKRIRSVPTWLAWIVFVLLRLWRLTLRVRRHDPAGLCDRRVPFPVIFVMWHNRLPFLGDLFPAWVRRSCAVLVSDSRDGEYAAALVRCLGIGVVRGSSSRGGGRALRQLLKTLRDGTCVVLTVDGPRGPRYELQPGVVHLARLAECPIVPVSMNAPHRLQLNSWDRTQIALPFSRVELRIGEPFVLDRHDRDDSDKALEIVRTRLLAETDDRRGRTRRQAEADSAP